jgi:hypothetical protein
MKLRKLMKIIKENQMNVIGETLSFPLPRSLTHSLLLLCSLRDDLKSQAEQLILAQKRVREIQIISTENESKFLPLQYELNTVKREKEMIENRNQFLEKELELKSNEFYQNKREQLSAVQALELQLAQKNNECGEYQEKIKQFEVRDKPLTLHSSSHLLSPSLLSPSVCHCLSVSLSGSCQCSK